MSTEFTGELTGRDPVGREIKIISVRVIHYNGVVRMLEIRFRRAGCKDEQHTSFLVSEEIPHEGWRLLEG